MSVQRKAVAATIGALTMLTGVTVTGVTPALAGTRSTCHKGCTPTATTVDSTAPAVAIGSPVGGSTVSGTVSVSGSSSDAGGVAAVDVSVDGGGWQRASGTTSWSWSWGTTGLANGSHTLTARATDTSGNLTSTSTSVNVSNPVPDTTAPSVAVVSPASGATASGTTSVTGSAADDQGLAKVEVSVDGGPWAAASGTSSWTWSWATTAANDGTHVLQARATDTSGNVSTANRSVTVSNSSGTTTTTTAPDTQGSWTSPEGVHINVNSAGSWTIRQIYTMLQANALDLGAVGPHLTINVQDSQASYTTFSAGMTSGRYTTYVATIWLQGTSSTFATGPDSVLAHEYGHAWSQYTYYMVRQGSWGQYLTSRWTTSDGSLNLATDSRTNSSYTWTISEIAADDYRMLFGSALAVSQRTHLNTSIPDPRNVPGLRDYLVGAFRTA
jgi:hypothetical protein